MTLKALVKSFELLAQENDVEVEGVKWLATEISGLSPQAFYLQQNDEINTEIAKKMTDAVYAYVLEAVPVQHILGYAYFYGYQFNVNEHVLIPRRETEELAEQVLIYADKYFDEEKIDVVDLGCGSGCISVTLALEEPKFNVLGTDISDEALLVAKSNAEKLGVNVLFRVSDWFSNITEKFDIIVANPPYIPAQESVERTVDKEPSLALFGGEDGLKFYRVILENAQYHLKEKGLVAFEHGYQQKDDIKKLVENFFPEGTIIQKQDMQGKDRFTFVGFGGVLNFE